MQHLVFQEPGKIAWETTADPALPGPTGALVRPRAVARCDLDPVMAGFGMFPGPFPVGHEVVADVVAVGDDVSTHAVGDRVVVPFQVSCGACDACTSGRTPACRPHRASAGAAFGFGPAGGGHGGGMADLLAVPHADHLLLAAPAGIADEVLCTVPDNLIDGYRSVAPQLQRFPGADVLVVGGLAASVGLYAVHAACALGAGSVTYVDDDAERLAAAAALGAVTVEHDGTWPRRFERVPIVVENTGDADGLACAARSVDDGGLLTSIAIHFTPVPLPLIEMYTRGITFHTSRADSRGLLPEVLDLVAAGTLRPHDLPTTTVAWDDAADAWLAPALKLVVTR